jgi:hypothetical protein
MLLAAAIMLYPGSILGLEPGGAQQIVFFVTFPLYFFGAWAVQLIGQLMGRPHPEPKLDPAESNGLGLDPILIFLASLIINMVLVWAGLKLICSVVLLNRRKFSNGTKNRSTAKP